MRDIFHVNTFSGKDIFFNPRERTETTETRAGKVRLAETDREAKLANRARWVLLGSRESKGSRASLVFLALMEGREKEERLVCQGHLDLREVLALKVSMILR